MEGNTRMALFKRRRRRAFQDLERGGKCSHERKGRNTLKSNREKREEDTHEPNHYVYLACLS